MKNQKRVNSKKNPQQAARGKKRAREAGRDEKGRFIKENKPAEKPAGKPAENIQPNNITTTNREENEMKKKETEKTQERRAFEEFVDQAMTDEYWLELIIMRTGLPLKKKRREITEIFKRHVILMGKDTEIYSVKEAKNYFANYTRKGTATHKELIQSLRRTTSDHGEEDSYKYEETNPETGERSYCGIPIPTEAPARPNENAVWNRDNNRWEL